MAALCLELVYSGELLRHFLPSTSLGVHLGQVFVSLPVRATAQARQSPLLCGCFVSYKRLQEQTLRKNPAGVGPRKWWVIVLFDYLLAAPEAKPVPNVLLCFPVVFTGETRRGMLVFGFPWIFIYVAQAWVTGYYAMFLCLSRQKVAIHATHSNVWMNTKTKANIWSYWICSTKLFLGCRYEKILFKNIQRICIYMLRKIS